MQMPEKIFFVHTDMVAEYVRPMTTDKKSKDIDFHVYQYTEDRSDPKSTVDIIGKNVPLTLAYINYLKDHLCLKIL